MAAIEDDLGWSIQQTSEKTSESVWKVKDRLRRGEYRARKAGRRTIVEPASVREVWAKLPIAKFAPPRSRRRPSGRQSESSNR
jgi:hypothetical protein